MTSSDYLKEKIRGIYFFIKLEVFRHFSLKKRDVCDMQNSDFRLTAILKCATIEREKNNFNNKYKPSTTLPPQNMGKQASLGLGNLAIEKLSSNSLFSGYDPCVQNPPL